MTALATTALFLLLQAATPAATPPQHDHGEMQAKASSANDLAKPIQDNINFVAKEFTSVADAMPEDKFSFAPSGGEFKDVRTFGQQVTHVANANAAFAYAVLNNQKPPKDFSKTPKTKAEIMAYLKESFDALDKAAATLTAGNANDAIANPFGGANAPYGAPPTRLGMLVLATAHCRDHYGQMVEYERMNSIIPPPSRPK